MGLPPGPKRASDLADTIAKQLDLLVLAERTHPPDLLGALGKVVTAAILRLYETSPEATAKCYRAYEGYFRTLAEDIERKMRH